MRKTWDFIAIMEEASKYKLRSDFNRHAPGAYRAARKLGILEQLFPIVKVVIDPARLTAVSTRVIGLKPIDESKRGMAREEADEIIYRWHRHLPLFIEEINRAIKTFE